jgi:hypothetical protein
VEKKGYTFVKRKRKESSDETSISKIDWLLCNESICNVNSNSCCSFNCYQYFPHEKMSIVW